MTHIYARDEIECWMFTTEEVPIQAFLTVHPVFIGVAVSLGVHVLMLKCGKSTCVL